MNKETRLLQRIDRNYADYREKIARMDLQGIFQKAVEIASTKEMYEYLNDRHQFEPEQLDYMLRFQNPLEVLRDQYVSGCWNKDDALENVVQTACDRQEALSDYPLMKPTQEKER
jgi:hypothetical protein